MADNNNLKKDAKKLVRYCERQKRGLILNTIENEIDEYNDSLLYLISENLDDPVALNAIEKTLITICGWGFESLADRAKDNKDYYDNL